MRWIDLHSGQLRSWGHLKTSPLTYNDTVVYVCGIEINDQPL